MKKMVISNMGNLLNCIIHCGIYDSIVFGRILREQYPSDDTQLLLNLEERTAEMVSLISFLEALRQDLRKIPMQEKECRILLNKVYEAFLRIISYIR